MVVGLKVVSGKQSSHWAQMRTQKDFYDNLKVAKYQAQTKRSKFISKCPKPNFQGGTNKLLLTMDLQTWLNWPLQPRETTLMSTKVSTRPQECLMAQNNRFLEPQRSLCSILTLPSSSHQITNKLTCLNPIPIRLITTNSKHQWTT